MDPGYVRWLQEKIEKEGIVFTWCSIFHWQKVHNNTIPPDTAELKLNAILSVLDAMFGCYHSDCPQTEIASWSSAPAMSH